MARVKRGVTSHARHKKVLKQVKGQYGRRKNTIRIAKQALEKGDKVKFTVKFRGREMQHTHLGNKLMDRIINDTAKLGKVEVRPKFEGRQIIMIVQPL